MYRVVNNIYDGQVKTMMSGAHYYREADAVLDSLYGVSQALGDNAFDELTEAISETVAEAVEAYVDSLDEEIYIDEEALEEALQRAIEDSDIPLSFNNNEVSWILDEVVEELLDEWRDDEDRYYNTYFYNTRL